MKSPNKNQKISGGLYLVVDPKPGLSILPRVECALRGGVDIIQLWNNWNSGDQRSELILGICSMSQRYGVPVLINENWQLLNDFPLDGIHFDQIPKNWNEIKEKLNRPFMAGITCGNEENNIAWAINNNLDYISFCSMFPSTSATSCELINPAIIKLTRQRSDIPIFVSGGITPKNISSLLSLGINGVAIISGILKAENSEMAAAEFKRSLQHKTTYVL